MTPASMARASCCGWIEASETTLQRLVEHFDVPRAAIIRQLLAQATPDTFPASWHLRVAERHGAQPRPDAARSRSRSVSGCRFFA